MHKLIFVARQAVRYVNEILRDASANNIEKSDPALIQLLQRVKSGLRRLVREYAGNPPDTEIILRLESSQGLSAAGNRIIPDETRIV
jgi:hypothetical protein